MGRKKVERVYMPLFFSWGRMFAEVPADDVKDVILAALEYSEYRTEPELSGIRKVLFEAMRPNIDYAIDHFEEVSKARSHPKKPPDDNVPKCTQMGTLDRKDKDMDTDMAMDRDSVRTKPTRNRKIGAWANIPSHEYSDEQFEAIENAGKP